MQTNAPFVTGRELTRVMSGYTYAVKNGTIVQCVEDSLVMRWTMRAITVHGQKGEKMEGLISTDALLKRTDWYSPDVRDAVRNALRYVPTVDAVEVVRCKDCRWYENDGYHTHCRIMRLSVEAEDYCSRGERREDGKTN